MPRRDHMPQPMSNVNWRRVKHDVCDRKTVFTTHTEARQHIGRGDIRMRVYRCPFCQALHLGHIPNMKTLRRIATAIRARAQDAA